MFYKILQFILQQFLSFHFKEIKSFNVQAIPKNGPLLIAASHPNSFLDAILIATTLKRPLHFLARSDVFKQKWSNFILRKLNLIPIYRLREGRENLHKNEETFEECYQILKNNGAILIFAEGISVGDKLLRPLKKGLARIAFGYQKSFPEESELQLMACGINYEKINQFNSKILIGFSDLISWKDIHEDQTLPTIKKYAILNQRISIALKEHSIVVSPEDEKLHQALVELDPCYEQNSLIRKALIADKISALKNCNTSKYKDLKKEIFKMEKILTPFHLDFKSLKHKVEVKPFDLPLYIIFWPFAFLSKFLNGIPFEIAKFIAKKTTAKDPEFYMSVRFCCGCILWLFWAVALSITLANMISPFFIILPFILYLLAKIQLNNRRRWKLLIRLRWLRKIKTNQLANQDLQEEIRKILKLRTALGLMPKP